MQSNISLFILFCILCTISLLVFVVHRAPVYSSTIYIKMLDKEYPKHIRNKTGNGLNRTTSAIKKVSSRTTAQTITLNKTSHYRTPVTEHHRVNMTKTNLPLTNTENNWTQPSSSPKKIITATSTKLITSQPTKMVTSNLDKSTKSSTSSTRTSTSGELKLVTTASQSSKSATISKVISTPATNVTIPVTKSTRNSTVKGSNQTGPFVVCIIFRGGMGNMMFEYASAYGIAKSKGMRVIVSISCPLLKVFKLDADIREKDCDAPNIQQRNERQASAYDPNILKFNNKNVKLSKYLQSYLYFEKYSKEIRQQFTFKDDIFVKAKSIFTQFQSKFNITNRTDVSLIGIHVRRGNMVNNTFGYNVASKEYLTDAINWYTSRYSNIYFIAASNDITWTKQNLPKNISVDYITSGSTQETDMAVLTMCEHVITTVGSYGWWGGWLAGGNVTYYKWPAKEGTSLRNVYSKNYTDYFLPSWIGL